MSKKHYALGCLGLILIFPLVWALEHGPMGARDSGLPILSTLSSFELRNQDGNLVSADSMRGKIQVVDFIFTSCPGVCPLLTEQMRQMEKSTRSLGSEVHFVSISVDPQTDTPEKLKEYAQKRRLDLSRWDFLTGSLDAVERVVVEGFKSSMGKRELASEDPGSTSLMEITHGENFVLIDRSGRLRVFHDVKNDDDQRVVIEMIGRLVRERN